MDLINEKIGQSQNLREEKQSFIEPSLCDDDSPSQFNEEHHAGDHTVRVQNGVSLGSHVRMSTQVSDHVPGQRMDINENHQRDSSTFSSEESLNTTTNRQEYDRRLSVFLGTTRPFQRRRTREEQEIETNFRWSMCLRHKYTLIFFVCIAVFVIGIIVSLLLKK